MQDIGGAVGRVVVLGTGGTIAGTAAQATDAVGYRAAQLGVADLLRGLPVLAGREVESEQVAQVDSRDMGPAVWQALLPRVLHHLAREDVAGLVITHGTDTLEETAFLLHRLVPTHKPVVLTAAMRPASSVQADGPQNLLDALGLACTAGVRGVLVVVAGSVWCGGEVRKTHTFRLDAFGAGDAGPLASLVQGRVQRWREWPVPGPRPGTEAALRALVDTGADDWPWVEIVTSHAGASGRLVDLLVGEGVDGLVVAATGQGTVHGSLVAALQRARAAGVALRVATRVPNGPLPHGPLAEPAQDLGPLCSGLTPAQARIDLLLDLLGAGG